MYGRGTDWAGLVVEAVAGCSLEEFMQRNIFKPLDMSSTTFYISNRPELLKRRAAMGFRKTPTSPLTGTPARPSFDLTPVDPNIAVAGAGLFTTANDYSRLLTALLCRDTRLLNKTSSFTELLFRPQLAEGSGSLNDMQALFDGVMHELGCPEFPVGMPVNQALAGALNMEDLAGRRRKGSVMWSGLTNPRWWIDERTGVAGTLFVQALPMADLEAIRLYGEVERALYEKLDGPRTGLEKL